MSLTRENIRQIANLARLSLTDEELDKYRDELSQVLGYVEQLKELDTKNVEPMIGAVFNQKAYREDKAIDSGIVEAMLKNAPDSEGTAIKVPQMS